MGCSVTRCGRSVYQGRPASGAAAEVLGRGRLDLHGADLCGRADRELLGRRESRTSQELARAHGAHDARPWLESLERRQVRDARAQQGIGEEPDAVELDEDGGVAQPGDARWHSDRLSRDDAHTGWNLAACPVLSVAWVVKPIVVAPSCAWPCSGW